MTKFGEKNLYPFKSSESVSFFKYHVKKLELKNIQYCPFKVPNDVHVWKSSNAKIG